jgi:hypothetical protein
MQAHHNSLKKHQMMVQLPEAFYQHCKLQKSTDLKPWKICKL